MADNRWYLKSDQQDQLRLAGEVGRHHFAAISQLRRWLENEVHFWAPRLWWIGCRKCFDSARWFLLLTSFAIAIFVRIRIIHSSISPACILSVRGHQGQIQRICRLHIRILHMAFDERPRLFLPDYPVRCGTSGYSYKASVTIDWAPMQSVTLFFHCIFSWHHGPNYQNYYPTKEEFSYYADVRRHAVKRWLSIHPLLIGVRHSRSEFHLLLYSQR